MISLTSPTLIEGYLPRKPQRTLGIIALCILQDLPFSVSKYSKYFFITWGQVAGDGVKRLWCNIWTLREIWGKIWPWKRIESGSMLKNIDAEAAMREVVEYVEHRNSNSWLLQPPSTKNPMVDEKVVGRVRPLKVRVKVENVTFIGRSIFRMDIQAEPYSEEDLMGSSKVDSQAEITPKKMVHSIPDLVVIEPGT
jgi:hypothetical protein